MLFDNLKTDVAGDHVRQTIQHLVDQIQRKKEKLVIEAFEKHTGEKYILEEEMKYRFRRVLVEVDQSTGHEHYYYNNGTREGHRLISFVNHVKQPEPGELFTISHGFTYY